MTVMRHNSKHSFNFGYTQDRGKKSPSTKRSSTSKCSGFSVVPGGSDFRSEDEAIEGRLSKTPSLTGQDGEERVFERNRNMYPILKLRGSLNLPNIFTKEYKLTEYNVKLVTIPLPAYVWPHRHSVGPGAHTGPPHAPVRASSPTATASVPSTLSDQVWVLTGIFCSIQFFQRRCTNTIPIFDELGKS